MSKFRKKPIVIEATQFTAAMVEAYLWDRGKLPEGCTLQAASHHSRDRKLHSYHVIVRTLEGDMDVSDGDWIITGIAGERYPCKPDIFAATYEPV